MWTAKRILLLAGGFALFLGLFVVYAYFLGGIDGLPPLPAPFGFAVNKDIKPTPDNGKPPPDEIEGEPDRRLKMAFGPLSDEYKRSIRIEVRSRGMCMGSEQFNIEPDGRLKLTPFSIALFSKDRGDGSYPEINTVKSDEAYLRFDQPITNPTDMGSRKIIGAELRGAITLKNNRRTEQKNDDIEVYITGGPLYYDEKLNKVWTEGFVRLLDTQTQPQPTVINAKGLDLHLSKDTKLASKSDGSAAGNRAKNDNVSGVDLIVLRSNVEMHLHVDAQSGFLAGGQKPDKAGAAQTAAAEPAKGAGKKVPERSHIVIKTQGPFTYDLPKDLADFQSPPPQNNPEEKDGGLFPEQVLVTREHVQGESKLYDQLVCDHLRLQFRRKTNVDPSVVRDNRSADREIETAHATARQGKEVVLSMDTEHLDAHGSELIYHTGSPVKGPQTILRGEPLHAVKDAHKIRARELHLCGADPKGEGQQGFARGPGQIDLLDRNSSAPKANHPYHILFRDTMTVVKDREGEQVYDLLTFSGDAAFIDEEHKQDLRAEKLQVWLEPAERQESPSNRPQAMQTTAPEAPRQRPHKLEAFEHVTARAPELTVRETEYLIVRFKDGSAPALPELLPPVAADEAPTDNGHTAEKRVDVTPALPPMDGAGKKDDPTARTASEQPKQPKRPIDLKARRVAVYVLRAGAKNELQELVTEGTVHVHQEGATPQDKGVDIKGETLNLLHHAQGDTLVVFGDSRGPAQLQLGELFLVGPKVTINQKDNTAEVEGVGAMHLPSNTTFDGSRPKTPGTRLTVHWTKDMLFNGKDADFHGGVVAYQDNASVRCQTMQVSLDKVVSFKEGQKGGQGAKVEKLVCDRKVYIADTTRDPSGNLLRYERLVAQQLTMDNQQGPIIATGPLKVYLFQHGTVDAKVEPVPPAQTGDVTRTLAQSKPGSPDQELHLTRVDCQGRMFSDNKDKTRVAKFYDNVEVYHLPAENPDIKTDPERLPKGGIYMRCERLAVYSKAVPDSKTTQYMRAEKNVFFRTQEFYGRSDVVKYDQSQEQIIFEGGPSNPATLYRVVRPGDNAQTITGRSILYNRRTGIFQVDGGKEIRW